MAINSLSPAFIKIRYSRTGVGHVMTIPTKFYSSPTPGSDPSLINHFGVSVLFSTAMEAFRDLLKPMFTSAISLDNAEVWSQPTPADNPVWVYTHGLTAAGTGTGTLQVAAQQVFPFRTDLGGLFRLYLMETLVAVNQAKSYSATANPELALENFITGATSWLYGRDNGKPILSLGWKSKTNDVLRRKLLTG